MRRHYRPVLGLATEGWALLLPLAALLLWLATHGHGVAAAVLGVPWLVLAMIFHDPEREIPSAPLGIVSPVDGRIESVERGYDEVLKREAVIITIRVSPLGSYAVRSPTEGVVCAPPARWKGRPTSWIRTDEGDCVLLACTAGALGGTPPMRYAYGSRVGQGQRCSQRRLARRFELVLPADVRVEVEPGQRVRSGSDLLASLTRKG